MAEYDIVWEKMRNDSNWITSKEINTLNGLPNGLLYDPDRLEVNMRYLKGEHYLDVIQYMLVRFPNNFQDLQVQMQDILKNYITAQSNLFKYGVRYEGLDIKNKDIKRLITRLNNEMVIIEQYKNVGGQSLLWTYSQGKKRDVMSLRFKALDASKFYPYFDENGNLESVIVLNNYFFVKNVLKARFILFKEGKIYTQISESWSELNFNKWETQKIKIGEVEISSTYDVLPFVLFTNDSLLPSISTLIDFENGFVAGDAYAILTFYISLLKRFALEGNVNPSQFDDVAVNLGIPKSILKIPENARLTIIEPGDTNNQKNFKEYSKYILSLKAKADGVDINNLFPDFKVESGDSRRVQLLPVIDTREGKKFYYTEKMFELFELINDIFRFGLIIEDVIYNDLPNQLDKMEEISYKKQEFELIKSEVDSGFMTKIDGLMKIHGMDRKQAEEYNKEIMEEKGEDIIFEFKETKITEEEEPEEIKEDKKKDEKENLKTGE